MTREHEAIGLFQQGDRLSHTPSRRRARPQHDCGMCDSRTAERFGIPDISQAHRFFVNRLPDSSSPAEPLKAWRDADRPRQRSWRHSSKDPNRFRDRFSVPGGGTRPTPTNQISPDNRYLRACQRWSQPFSGGCSAGSPTYRADEQIILGSDACSMMFAVQPRTRATATRIAVHRGAAISVN